MNDDIIEGTNVLKLHSMDAYMEHVHSHSSSHVDHMDPSLMVFFFMETQGWEKETLPTSYPGKNPIQFLSHYNKFQISRLSTQAKAMEETLGQCETKTHHRKNQVLCHITRIHA